MNFILDFSVLERLTPEITPLSQTTDFFIILPSNISFEEAAKYFRENDIKTVSFFQAPPKERGTLNVAAWKANTAKALRADLYLTEDYSVLEQARVIGVNVAFFKL